MTRSAVSILILACAFVACGSEAPPTGADHTSPVTEAPSTVPSGSADAGPSPSTPSPDAHRVSVLQFNVLHGFPDFKDLDARTKITADTIKALAPDFVLVQEIGQSALLPNRASVLASMTGYEWHWKKASGVAGVFEEGPGILSRWPLVWKDGVTLPHTTNFGLATRVVCAARAQTPFGEVQLFSAHLSDENDETISADQAKTALDYIAAHPSPLPGFLAGDMNASPDALAMRVMRGDATYQGTKGNLIDAWATVHPTDPGYTEPNTSPNHRIDYVYAVPGSTSTKAKVEECKIVFDTPVGGIYASDHLGVFCTFSVP